MFGWLFKAARKEARGWNHTNFFNAAKPARRAPSRWNPMRRRTALDAAREKIKRLEDIIKQKNNTIRQLKKVNKAQAPMADSGVNTGTYRLYQQHFRNILAITQKRQRLSTYTMPEIRRECDAALGLSKPTEFKGYPKR